MNRLAMLLSALFVLHVEACWAQVGGNINYAQAGAKARAEQQERSKRILTKDELPPTGTSSFVEADVLMNVKADEFVASFAIAQEGATVAECGSKMDSMSKELIEAFKALGVSDDDIDLDFASQTKIYGFEMVGDIAREKLVGFELKKNLSVRYKDRSLLDKLVIAAARLKVYDLIKVDYVVRDIDRVQEQLVEEAAKVIKQKAARYEKLLGIKLQAPAQVFAERPAIHYPSEMYDSYIASEAESMEGAPDRPRLAVQRTRKSQTFFFHGLDGDGFDKVINPVIIEPVVQFTLHLKVKYEVEQTRAR